MKKYFLLLVVLFGLSSCEEDIKFNNPSFQGLKDNVFWRAVQTKATVQASGVLNIDAYTGNEVVHFVTGNALPNTYILGTGVVNKVSYVKTDLTGVLTYETGLDMGDGQIIVTEYDQVNKTISGNFKFNAKNTDGNSLDDATLNFQQGIFYKIPVTAN